MTLNIEWSRLRRWIDNFGDKSISKAGISQNALILAYKYVSDLLSLQEEANSVAKLPKTEAEAALVTHKLIALQSRKLNYISAWKEYERDLLGYVGRFRQIHVEIKGDPMDMLRGRIEIRVRELRELTAQYERNRQRAPPQERGPARVFSTAQRAALGLDRPVNQETDFVAGELAAALWMEDDGDIGPSQTKEKRAA